MRLTPTIYSQYTPSTTATIVRCPTWSDAEQLITCLVAVALLFSYWTFERNKIWKDELTLWADNHKKSPNKSRVNQHLGETLINANRVDEAIPILEKTLQLYEEEIKLQKSVSTYETSVNFYNLGIAYKEKGLYKKAMFYLNRALEEFYFSGRTHYLILP